MTAEWLCRGQFTGHPGSVVIIDGDNGFDLFIFGDVARRSGLRSEAILRNIFVSRAFTCHQLQALIVERLIPVIRKTGSQIIIVLGLLTTFYDEQVPLWEARRLLRPTLGRLYGLAQRGYSILLLLPDEPRSTPKRQEFLKLTKSCVEKIFRIHSLPCGNREKDFPALSFRNHTLPSEAYRVSVHQEKPVGGSGDWEIVFDSAMQPRQRWQNIR